MLYRDISHKKDIFSWYGIIIELLLGYNDGKIFSVKGNVSDRKKIRFIDVLPQDRLSRYALHPLQYEGVYLGYAIIELNRSNLEGATHDRFQKVFSTALRGYLSVERETQALTIISNIQKKLLQEITPARYGDFDVSAISQPLTPGGGDLFNVFHSESSLMISIGDVEGHGVRAGIIMMLTLYTYQMLVKEDSTLNPRSFLEKLNTRIYEIIATNLELFSYVTFIFLRQTSSNEFTYAGLHNALIIYSKNEKRCRGYVRRGRDRAGDHVAYGTDRGRRTDSGFNHIERKRMGKAGRRYDSSRFDPQITPAPWAERASFCTCF